MRPLSIAAILMLVAAGCGGGSKSGSGSITVRLNARNGSGENGTATLTPNGNATEVKLELTGAPANKQPAHIHLNMCGAALGDVYYTLNDVVNGTSTTKVPHSLSDLQASPYAINVHKSYDRIETFVSCGDIPSKGY
jgi:hypothetical protein